ncbi:hypothetical protein HBH56_172140 [Parastagonospora nodorum]|uniref:Uncharacterized protein n=2 Tax=Phaeosphaeria nodorum (strain SN15 / ATCC MYA-4574 / FGSC 10173) TaxID=321614 RepID=Q0UKA5_PHANO|nr:hypothetical protein SNOG_07809 [Parastagonospora nodorum SN15]KAH3908793.1 hypothetical protein HBH56_172140 [Parastagonospora nodorum]EAT85275.2 hypothetical protein SNOG_07809 [Parastagonospora nodorum SN15]KAH3928573.1 hypothetical protein HBH54_140700 [Parastagonospora nodorum]KAH3985659.1 hypothetical protein HBH51_017070 [Parastagonospora nodorum]KAH4142284.1 hypothetical protein HBH45_049600 [Parastagonospora nodorum]
MEVFSSRPASSTESTSRSSSHYYYVGSSEAEAEAESIDQSASSDITCQWHDSREVLAMTEEQKAEKQPLPWLEEPVDEVQSAFSKLDKTLDEIYVVAKDLEEDENSASEYSSDEHEAAAADTITPSGLLLSVHPSMATRIKILQHFLLDVLIFMYSITSSSLSSAAKQSKHEFFQSPYGGPCLMKVLEREKILYLSHIVLKPILDTYEAHVVQEYVVQPSEKLCIPMECVIEQLQNYFWHQCTPVNRHKAIPYQLAALCRDDVLLRKTRRQTLAGRLATDEYMALKVTDTKDLQAALSRKIRGFGIDALGTGWTEEFVHLLRSPWTSRESRNFKVELEVALAGDRELAEYAASQDGPDGTQEQYEDAKMEWQRAKKERDYEKVGDEARRRSVQSRPALTKVENDPSETEDDSSARSIAEDSVSSADLYSDP